MGRQLRRARLARAFPLSLVLLLALLFQSAAAFLLPSSAPHSLHRQQQQQQQKQRPPPLAAVTTVQQQQQPQPQPPPLLPPPVRREYETWQWRGFRINYRVEGPEDAPPLLLIHGFGASVNHFRNQFQMLPPLGYRVYAVDLLGFGASDKVKDGVEYELELWRDLLVDFMEEMEGQQGARADWTVMGNSIGGLLTLMVAEARGPEHVKGAVLLNCAGGLTSFRDEELPWYFRPLWIFVRAVLFGETLGPSLFQRFRTEENVRSVLSLVYMNATAVDDELVQTLLLPGQDDGAEEVFLKVLRAPAGPSPESILPSIKVPIIAIWGEDDPWTPLTTGAHPGSKFHLYNQDFILHALPNTGHCPMDERPLETLEVLRPFLQRVYDG